VEGRDITTEDLKKLLRKETKGLWNPNSKQATFQDAQFYLPSEAETMALIDAHQQANVQGGLILVSDRGEGYDCDDYTKSLYGFVPDFAAKNWDVKHSVCIGMAIGIFRWMTSELHSCNWVYLSDGGLKWIEPQTGSLHEVDECVAFTLRNLIV
jgi:hypothetical protein